MLAAVLAFQVTSQQVVTFVAGGLSTGALVVGLFDKRRKDIAKIWRDLAEARGEKVADQDQRISRLEAKVDLLQSDFAAGIAASVAAEIVKAIGDRP